MLERLRSRSNDESGFTLVELLVVMLIIGILAAIAIPSFFSQRDKANDADAKSAARTAQTSIETFATDNEGSYLGAQPGDLTTIEPTLTGQTLAVDTPSAKSYSVSVTSSTDNVFTITRNEDGTSELTCTGSGGGCNNGHW